MQEKQRKLKKGQCPSCWGKKYYTQMYGEVGSDDFGGEGYEIAPTIHKKPCSACKGTGKKPKQELSPEEMDDMLLERAKGCLSPELSWEERIKQVGGRFDEWFKEGGEYEFRSATEVLAFTFSELKLAIKLEREQAFNSGRASMVEEVKEIVAKCKPPRSFDEKVFKQIKMLYDYLKDDILQALKNKETKE